MAEKRVSRQMDYVRRTRAEVFALLGGKCVSCGAVENLTIEHPKGRMWEPNKLSSSSRWARYKREAKAKLVELKCEKCNLSCRYRKGQRFVPTVEKHLVDQDCRDPDKVPY